MTDSQKINMMLGMLIKTQKSQNKLNEDIKEVKASQEIFAAALKTQLKSETSITPANPTSSLNNGLEEKFNKFQLLDGDLTNSKKNNDKISIDD